MLEGQVELHLGWSVEEAEEPVADLARLVELVDQDARRTLGAPAPRRGYDVHDQRTLVLPEMRRHLRASFPSFLPDGDRTVAAKVASTFPLGSLRLLVLGSWDGRLACCPVAEPRGVHANVGGRP